MSSLDDLFDTKPKKSTPPEVNREADLVDMVLDSEGQLLGLFFTEPDIYIESEVNKKYLSKDARFLVDILDSLVSKGVNDITNVTLLTEVSSLGLKEQFDEIGGIKLIEDLKKITRVENRDAIIDNWNKWQLIKTYYKKGILDINKVKWDNLIKMKSSDVYDWVEFQLNSIDLDVSTDFKYENISYDDKDIEDLMSGVNIGLQYAKHCPLLNYLTMGIEKGDIYLLASYTNEGKSSFIFNNQVIPMCEGGHKVCVISNEQTVQAFKVLLQVYILTERLNYWKLTRKHIKAGKFSDEDLKMMKKAQEIAKKEFDPVLKFVKLYDYDTQKVNKIVKKLSKQGYEAFVYDTFKIGETESKAVWESLLADSKQLFQIASRNKVAVILSMQLALSTKDHVRFLNESVLSNSKAVSEVVSTGVYFRTLWSDERDGETHDIKPYRLKKSEITGKYEKEYITLDKEKKYKIFFLSKCRSDENGIAIVYEFNGAFNKWKEIGYCTPSTKNVY